MPWSGVTPPGKGRPSPCCPSSSEDRRRIKNGLLLPPGFDLWSSSLSSPLRFVVIEAAGGSSSLSRLASPGCNSIERVILCSSFATEFYSWCLVFVVVFITLCLIATEFYLGCHI